MRIEQILPVAGPMIDSTDSEYLQSGKGVVRKRVNLRPEKIGEIMANVPIPGTVLVETELPDGTNETVGWCRDNEKEAFIWFVYNSNGNHCIYRYYTITGETEKVFYAESSLGFTADTNIIAEVIDGRLYWNDNTDQPKGFNLEKAVNYTKGETTNAYTSDDVPFDENIFPYIKKPPRFAPTVSYESLTEFEEQPIDFNNLRKKLWQVKYNYVYEDSQESVWSSISKVPLPQGEVTPTGQWVSEITQNNALKVTVNTGSNNVKKIKVAVRDASVRNTGPFYEFAEIDKEADEIVSDITYDVYFLNNTYMSSIDTDYGNAYFHNIPLAAKDFILLDGKYGAMSMPKIGYNFKESAVDYSLSYVESDTYITVAPVPMESSKEVVIGTPLFNDWSECGIQGTGRTVIKIAIPEAFEPNAVYRITFKTPDAPDDSFFVKQPEVTASYASPSVEPANYPKVVRDALISELNSEIDGCFTSTVGGFTWKSIPIKVRTVTDEDNKIRFDFYHAPWINLLGEDSIVVSSYNAWKPLLDDYTNNIYGTVITPESTPTYKTLKKGQYHPFAIVYNDEFHRYNVAFGKEEVFIPVPGDSSKVYAPKITINHTPPEWAHTYRIAYIPYNSYIYFQEVPAVEVIEGGEGNGVESGYKFLKINRAILDFIEEYPDSIVSAYEWQKGDRIREIGATDSYEILREFTRTYQQGDDTKVETGYLVRGDFNYMAGTSKIELVEVYRPNLTPQDKIYYEISEEFKILNPGIDSRVHAGVDQDQTSTLPAISTLDFGDVYFRARFSSEVGAGYALVEDLNLSDYYESSAINIGRGVVRTKSEQKTLKRVIKTENYIENTELNRLNIILAEDEYYPVSEVYGDITRILERGDTLKIVQPHREISVYIGKNYTKDADGNDVVLVSDKTFGSDREYEAFLGSSYSRSVAASANYMYFFDTSTGDFCRSAMNGTVSLAKQYGMQQYLDNKSRAFRSYTGEKDIIVSISPNDNTVYLTFLMGTIETLAFSENEGNKGFMFFVEFENGSIKPENFAWYGDDMYSFVGGKLYKHGFGPVNSFYGSGKKEARMEMITNKYPEIQKSFETMSLDANGIWTAEATIEADNNYPYGQKTKILSGMWKNREGRVIASMPKNIITRNGTESLQRLYSGNEMTGNAMEITISSVTFDKLREVKVTALNQV